jgi:hypothetical protein
MRELIRHILREEIISEMGKQLTTQDFIRKSKEIHGDRYDYSDVVYRKGNENVSIICPIHGNFSQKPSVHLRGFNCPKCGKESASKKIRKGDDSFKEEAFDVHGNKYDYSKVVYKNANTPVTIICPIHGEFNQSPLSHTKQNAGCPKCSRRYMDTDFFAEKSKEIHKDKYDYTLVDYKDNKTPVTIICPIHGEFSQVPNYHLTGNGCPQCGGSARLNTNTFIDRSKEKHGDKYDYSKVAYKNANTPVTIICPIHGEFKQKPNKHMSGQGCSECGKGISKYNTDKFIELCKEKHGDKYSYDKTNYIGSLDYVTITCPKHGDFSQVAIEHRRGSGCPRCLESKGEVLIGKLLHSMEINFIRQKKFEDCKGTNKIRCRRLPFDFYLPNYNTIIEYDGKQHYEPIDIFGGKEGYERIKVYDEIKNKYCDDNGIKMIRIPYNMKDNKIKEYIVKELGIK